MVDNRVPEIVKRYVAEVCPQMSVQAKNSSRLMRAIGWLFEKTRINPSFMKVYTTTPHKTAYVPDKLFTIHSIRLLEIIIHESVHVHDNIKSFYLFQIAYLFPQTLALLALLAFFSPWWLLCLLFLAPLPAPFRFWFELRAYRTSLLLAKHVWRYRPEEYEQLYQWVIGQLATKYYYFTWPFKTHLLKCLKDESTLETDVFYKKIVLFLEKENLTK